jgi:hypothetical protein
MSECVLENCLSRACRFIATRSTPTSTAQCGNTWHFTSSCNPSLEYAQVDMTLMYYIRSQTMFLYQMAAICLGDNCNNFATFLQLKNAITVDPDLSCLINDTTSSSTSTSISPISTTTSISPISTTTPRSSADYILMNDKLFIFIIFFSSLFIKQ